MRFTSDDQRKAVMAKLSRRPGRVLVHIAGPSGAGKTTLMRRLQRQFPAVRFKDLDDFSQKEPEWSLATRRRYRQWLRRQGDRPVVVVGFERKYTPGGRHVPLRAHRADMPIPPDARRYRLRTWPIVAAWRRMKREGRGWSSVLSRRFIDAWRAGQADVDLYDRLGYRPASAREIERDLAALLAGQQKARA
jgi:hypothetical protein